jgi:hypothetical protein
MGIRKVWYALISMMPFYGLYQGYTHERWDGHAMLPDPDPLAGFLAGLILSAILGGLTWGIRKIWRATSRK